MARLVLKEAQHSLEIPPSDKPTKICMCGLSKTQPYCDHSHRITRDEEPGQIYVYDEDGNRVKVTK